MTDITQYSKVIKEVLSSPRLKIRGHQKEDYSQECYVALIENQDKLEAIDPNDRNKLAAVICKRRIIDKFRKESREIKTDSASSRKISSKISQIPNSGLKNSWHLILDKSIFSGLGITEEQLQEAIRVLPYEDYKIIHSLYVEGKTQEEVAKDYGITRYYVRLGEKRGIIALKKFFEVK